ncbi:putative gustatory receptor 10b [Drosophila eugracilis]|uniref:putative gustatory receptor 10b n=1 Tax=Drosophila eugracilis TaxID=29029 RepID=UPI0007E7DCE8|nr:putative gustatory receptor 10b [Drosophila eugracilis]
MPCLQLLATMQVGKLCRLALRFWMGLTLVLGCFCHYYCPTRRRLVYSRLLQIFNWVIMIVNLGMYYFYFIYATNYFAKGTFRRQTFVIQLCNCSVNLQLLIIIVQSIWRLLREQEVCQAYNELSEILEEDLQLKEHSRFYSLAFLAKIHNFIHNFNFALSVLMIWGLRPFEVSDLLANFFYVYNSLARDSFQVAYILVLLNVSEALRQNRQQEPGNYLQFMRKLRRHEQLMEIGRRVHRKFAWLVAVVLFYQVYFNTATIYLGYSFFVQREEPLGLCGWNLKILLTVMSISVKLFDALLLQIICENLLTEENQICRSPKLQRQDVNSKAVHRQWEMSALRRAIRRASSENKVLGMFRMDMRCAFALISCSVSYGVIIIQIGYIRG